MHFLAAAQFGLLARSSLFNHDVVPSTPTVNLTGYGAFSGAKISETLTGSSLPTAVDAWLGIEYALQPVGQRRFWPVEHRPSAFDGVRPAASYGNVCIQDTIYTKNQVQDEACLNFNVYRTSDIPLEENLPTLVWIHGGSFVLGSARSMDGASFVASSKLPIAVVTFNYRLNSLGFLPSKLFAEEGLLNLGLRDQHFLLQFLQDHLESFGGDPKQITLGGRSAGGHSTGIHYFHNYGEDEGKPLFARAIFQSGSVTARAFPDIDFPQYKQDFKLYMRYLNCPAGGRSKGENALALDCLQQAPVQSIQSISAQMYAEAEQTLSWPFQPTLGGPLLEKPGSKSGAEETFHHLPVITSYVTDEGKYYTPAIHHTNDDLLSFMHVMMPYLNYTDIALLNELYPDPIRHPDSPWAHSTNATQYNRLSAAWSDMAYICPSRETAFRTSTAGVPTWRLHFNTPNYPLEYQAWRGIPHTSDSAYAFDSPGVAFPQTAHIYHAYLASFVATGNPNTARLEGTPEWPNYHAAKTCGADRPKQLIINPGTYTTVEEDSVRIDQCNFWNDLDRAKRLNK
ncbi:alpha/beta-hydrolase [Daldinia caldariorum]|uniref:alpha/beta-hydrolase n=1 Tax=Daldinia caldariorum TaxID=326644 RepID=UPI002008AB46|nr:alpha/beta-hydrolase [Daldinia caldariorum]KAI1467130.1 alpha/beta-hydrolase [Daldinia caldariorum]